VSGNDAGAGVFLTSIDADVGVADGGGADAEERLAGAGRRVSNVIDADPARLVKDERFQGLPPRSAIARLGLLGAAGAAGPRLRWGALTGWGLFRRGLRDLQLVRETGLPARRVVGMQDAFVGRPVKDRARPAHGGLRFCLVAGHYQLARLANGRAGRRSPCAIALLPAERLAMTFHG
jgi:hypothetical protein